MLTVKTTELELVEGWFDNAPERMRVQVAFPINKWAGSRDSAVVYFEVKPRDRLARHTDSAEEVLYIVAGEAEAEIGDQRSRISKGDLAVIPAMVPHSLRDLVVTALRADFSGVDALTLSVTGAAGTPIARFDDVPMPGPGGEVFYVTPAAVVTEMPSARVELTLASAGATSVELGRYVLEHTALPPSD
jgi:mannose-6-phosphate isomerase-like protein (cupin superfamily)